ncbi:MAG: hypothetical protein ABJN39_01725 [Sulfitobacter sp.]|uniref:hypothetical protein n=1 Tax=unclassified Sulfitobacter TaxID=196795 RepID=UPI0018171E5A|nr:hypothetical protein [Sulfitobacter sp. LC.270.F.C4]WOI16011.1 hypothetical protein R1T45_06360 [Sulfitobacter sp. LC.270.F.C4]HIF78908.1 hypothetical protein [Sulfitobacter sp.]
MSIQFSHSFDAAQNVTEITPITACVSMGKYATAQGELVWQKGEIACIRSDTALFIGKRI